MPIMMMLLLLLFLVLLNLTNADNNGVVMKLSEMSNVASRKERALRAVEEILKYGKSLSLRGPNDSSYVSTRQLAIGDFDELNAFLGDATIELPDANFKLSVFDIALSKLSCTGLSIGDVGIDFVYKEPTQYVLTLELIKVGISCATDWDLTALFISEDGEAKIKGSDNYIKAVVTFTSEDFATTPPTQVSMDNCDPKLQLDSMSFTNGGVLGSLLNTFEGQIKGIVEGEIGTFVCDLLPDLFTNELSGLLKNASDWLTPLHDYPIPEDVLAEEKNLTLPDGRNMLDLQTNSVLNLVTDLLENEIGAIDDATGEPKVNEVIRGVLPDGTFELAINSSLVSTEDVFTHTMMTLGLEAVKVGGLDTFTKLEILKPVGKFTMTHDFGMERLDLGVSMSLGFKSTAQLGVNYMEHFNVSVRLDDIDFAAATLTVIDVDAGTELHLGSVLDNPLPCVMSVFYALDLPVFHLTVRDAESPIVTSFVCEGLDRLVTKFVDLVFKMYEPSLLKALPGLSQGTIRELLSDYLKDLPATMEKEKCLPVPDPPRFQTDYLNFQDNDLLQMASDLVDDFLVKADDNGEPSINSAVIAPLTQNQSGTPGTISFFMGDEAFEGSGSVPNMFNTIEIAIGNLTVSNLDSVKEIRLLDFTSPHVIENYLHFGSPPKGIEAGVDIRLAIESDEVNLLNDARLTLTLEDIRVLIALIMHLNFDKVRAMSMGQLDSLNCWLSTLDYVGFQNISITFDKFQLGLDCRTCTSPGIREMEANFKKTSAPRETTDAVNNMLREVNAYLAGGSFAKFMNETLASAGPACTKEREQWARPTYQPTKSPTTVEDVLRQQAPAWTPVVIAGFVLGTLATLVILTYFIWSEWRLHRKPEFKKLKEETKRARAELAARTKSLAQCSGVIPLWLRVLIPTVLVINIGFFVSGHLSLGGTVDVGISVAGESILIPQYFAFSIANSVTDLFRAGAIELAILILLFSGLWPYIKIFTMLFLWFAPPSVINPVKRGNTFIWLDVLGKWSMLDIFVLVMTMVGFRIRITSPKDSAILPPMFYSVDLSVVPVWGLYANMIAQLLSQFVSHAAIHQHRNSIAAAGFRYLAPTRAKKSFASPGPGMRKGYSSASSSEPGARQVELTSISEEDVEKQKARMSTSSGWENTLASPGSPRYRVSTGMNSYYSNNADWEARERCTTSWIDIGTSRDQGMSTAEIEMSRTALESKEALRNHVFEVDGKSNYRVRIRGTGQILVLILMLVTVVLLFYGCTMESFRIEIYGLVGVIMNFGNPGSSSNAYSVVSMASMISQQAEDTFFSQLGINYIAGIFVLCSLCVPAIQIMALTYLWVVPLKLRDQKRMLILNEVCAAWQYLEVYLIGIVVALLQLGDLSKFMIADLCDDLDPTLQTLVSLGLIEQQDATCLHINPVIEFGAFVLLAASIMLNIMTQIIIRATTTAIEEREIRLMNIPKRCLRQRRLFRVILSKFLCGCCAVELKTMDPNRKNNKDKHLSIQLSSCGWEELLDTESGMTYYFDRRTGHTTWNKPDLKKLLEGVQLGTNQESTRDLLAKPMFGKNKRPLSLQ